MFKIILIAVFTTSYLMVNSVCLAQFGGNTGGGNTGGGATGGAGTGGNTGGGRTGGGAAATGGGQNAQSGQTLGTQNLNAADGSLSAQVGQNAFTGQAQNGFTGNRIAGQANANTGAASQFGNLGQGTNERPQNQVNTQRKQIRPQLRLAFDVPSIPPASVKLSLNERVVKVPVFVENASNVQINVDAHGTLTLNGKVSSDHERKLLEAYVRLEPGVRSVANKLILAE